MMEIIPPKVDESKTRKLPANPYRENMHRHVTKRKRRKGAHTGIVQDVFKKKRKNSKGKDHEMLSSKTSEKREMRRRG